MAWTDMTALTGLIAWYKPETLAASYANGDPIDTWADSSGNSRDLTGTTTTRPLAAASAINGYMAADFDGTDAKLWSSSFSVNHEPYHFYVVTQIDVYKSYNQFLCIDDDPAAPSYIGGWPHMFAYPDGSIGCFIDASSFYKTEDTMAGDQGLAVGTPTIISASSFLYDESSTEAHTRISMNGGIAGSGKGTMAASGTGYIGLGVAGVSSALDGKIVEAIITKGQGRGVDTPWIEGYLADKYAITLADGHLFKNAAPENAPTTYNATGGATLASDARIERLK